MEPIYKWHEEIGVAECTIYDPETNKPVTGVARCGPEDVDMKSEKTGCEIAYRRALIKLLKEKQSRTKLIRNAYKDLLVTYEKRPGYNKEDPLVRIARKRYYNTLEDIRTLESAIVNFKADLKSFIDEKDKFYVRLRKLR